MVTQGIFIGIVAAVVLQRLFEMRLSDRHAALLLAKGAQKHHSNYLPIVKGLQMAWFVAMIAEVYWFNRPWVSWLGAIALLSLVTGQFLRYLSMRALGERWTLPLITLPGAPVVNSGIYRYLRHPNWLGVTLEIAAVPLIHTAYLTAIIFSVANAFLMVKRIQSEEQALSPGTPYTYVFTEKPQFIPSHELLGEINHQNGK